MWNFSDYRGFNNILKTNCRLRCLKLPIRFTFKKYLAQELCTFLAKSKILEELQLNDSIMICSETFIDAISKNRSLKILVLKHCLKRDYYVLKYYTEDSIKLFSVLAYSLIEDFSMQLFNRYRDKFCCMKLDCDEINSIEKFLESLDCFLTVSEKIRKITITINQIPNNYVTHLADLIIKHVKQGKIEYFAGYNL